jgi:hypothetical protein
MDRVRLATRGYNPAALTASGLCVEGRPRERGRREGRVFATPMARLQTKSRRQSPQVWPQHPAFPARWCYGLYVISLVRRAFWPPSPARCEKHHRQLGISVGMPGPHDFTVRGNCARRAPSPRPSHPTPNVRDDAYAPLTEAGRGGLCINSEKTKVKYFVGRAGQG